MISQKDDTQIDKPMLEDRNGLLHKVVREWRRMNRRWNEV